MAAGARSDRIGKSAHRGSWAACPGLTGFADPAKAAKANDVIRICSQILHAAEHPLVVTAIGTLARMASLHEATVVSLPDEAGKTKRVDVLLLYCFGMLGN